ncbi:MAG TPA: M56 family metallopeptidase [Draconibacterium sp.]|nr:M56 family metallopeptidase [Draconibacterium sp.]HRX12700.1 M56 family metallopeptidase [Draconibacterium sp.]
MISVINFIVESGVSLALLSVIYVLFLRKETFFKINRWFLLGSVLFSVFLPILRFRVFNPKPAMLAEVTVTPYRNLLEAITVYSHDFSGSVETAVVSTNLLIYFYLAGVVFFFGRFLFRIIQILLIIRKNELRFTDGFKMVILKKEMSPFSFLNYVFVSQSLLQNKGYDKMISHELEHVKQGHSFDVIILEILTVFQWFNPFMWMLRHAIRENHEYLADQAVLTTGVNRGYYKKLLLDQFVGGQLVIANNFNTSLIKNRIKMMSKIKSPKYAISKLVFGVFVAAALIIAFACEQKESVETVAPEEQVVKLTIQGEKLKIDGTADDIQKLKSMFSEDSGFEIVTDSLGNVLLTKKAAEVLKTLDSDEQIFFIVEDMPEFPGGEMALRTYIANAVKYPVTAQEKGIQGKVYVTFVVGKDGFVKNTSIAKGVDPSLDSEALRVINNLPKWKPGIQKGVPVNVSYTVPINFKLQ